MLERIILSAPMASVVALIVGYFLAKYVQDKAREKVVKTILHAVVVTLETIDFPGDYDDFLLEVIKKLKEKDFDTKKEEAAALDELYEHKKGNIS